MRYLFIEKLKYLNSINRKLVLNTHINEAIKVPVAKMASQQSPAYGSLFARSTVKDVPGQFPPPVVVAPILEHRHTFIILHGRGSTAEKFGPPLLDIITTSGEKLQEAFPNAKLVFLTAPKTRATIYKRSYTHQWFDMWHMEERFKRQDLIRDGLGKVSVPHNPYSKISTNKNNRAANIFMGFCNEKLRSLGGTLFCGD